MYHSSTQRAHWSFQSRQQLTRARTEANAIFCRKVKPINYIIIIIIMSFLINSILKQQLVSVYIYCSYVICYYNHYCYSLGKECQFLTPSEEELLCLYYMKKLFEFCDLFTPPVPRAVLVSHTCTYRISLEVRPFKTLLFLGNSWCLF